MKKLKDLGFQPKKQEKCDREEMFWKIIAKRNKKPWDKAASSAVVTPTDIKGLTNPTLLT